MNTQPKCLNTLIFQTFVYILIDARSRNACMKKKTYVFRARLARHNICFILRHDKYVFNAVQTAEAFCSLPKVYTIFQTSTQ